MPVLDAQNLSKSLGTRTLLQGMNLTIARGEKIGLVGNNGAGKSTLARILAGKLDADAGVVNVRRGARVAYLDQDPRFDPQLTAREAALVSLTDWRAAKLRYDQLCAQLAHGDLVEESPAWKALINEQEQASRDFEHFGGWQRQEEAERVLKTLGITQLEQLVSTMSGGERRRVALAGLLVQAPDLAILDEPTNHLDADTIEWLEEYLIESFSGALLLITHDRFLLNRVVDRTVEIESGQTFSYEGGWEEFLIGREERNALKERTEANRQNFLRKEIEWLRRQPKARTGKQKARIKRAEAAIEAVPETKARALVLNMDEARVGGTILEARKLRIKIAERNLVEPFDLYLTKGMRLGIVGPSGAGKTTLLRTLLGQVPPGGGEVVMGKNTQVAYLDQQKTGLDDDQTVYDMVTGGRPSVSVGKTDYSSYSYLERFGFRGDALRQKVAGLSGGERARISLARLLLSTANVLVLDEPTNDLDVMTLSALEELLLDIQGVALIVTHDRYFLDRVATATLAIDRAERAHLIQGGYSNYAEFRKELERAQKQGKLDEKPPKVDGTSMPPSANPTRITPVSTSVVKKLTYAEQIELGGLMEKIDILSNDVLGLETQLADPELHTTRRSEGAQLQAELNQKQETLAELELRWLELEERRQG